MQVLSNGDATNAARGASTGMNNNVYHNKAYGSTLFNDPDLNALCAPFGATPLYDGIILTFDVTPTVSGPLQFRCTVQHKAKAGVET